VRRRERAEATRQSGRRETCSLPQRRFTPPRGWFPADSTASVRADLTASKTRSYILYPSISRTQCFSTPILRCHKNWTMLARTASAIRQSTARVRSHTTSIPMAVCIISPPAGQALTLPPPQSLPFSLQGLGFLPDPLLCLLLCCQWWAASTLRHAIVVPVHMIQTCCALVARMIILAESPRIWKRVLIFCSVGGRTAESSLPCTLAHPGQSVARNLLGYCQSLTLSSLIRAHNVPPFFGLQAAGLATSRTAGRSFSAPITKVTRLPHLPARISVLSLLLLLHTHVLVLYTQVVSPSEEFSGKTTMTVGKTAGRGAKSGVDTLHTYDDPIGFVSALPM